jgi:hypothetical protein
VEVENVALEHTWLGTATRDEDPPGLRCINVMHSRVVFVGRPRSRASGGALDPADMAGELGDRRAGRTRGRSILADDQDGSSVAGGLNDAPAEQI